jgi:hypothetical protein
LLNGRSGTVNIIALKGICSGFAGKLNSKSKSMPREIEQVADCDMIVLTEIRNNLDLSYFKSVVDYLGYVH